MNSSEMNYKMALMNLKYAIGDAGRLVGLADFRPTFGRFSVVAFTDLLTGEDSR